MMPTKERPLSSEPGQRPQQNQLAIYNILKIACQGVAMTGRIEKRNTGQVVIWSSNQAMMNNWKGV